VGKRGHRVGEGDPTEGRAPPSSGARSGSESIAITCCLDRGGVQN
jgi:hypothetical protein